MVQTESIGEFGTDSNEPPLITEPRNEKELIDVLKDLDMVQYIDLFTKENVELEMLKNLTMANSWICSKNLVLALGDTDIN